MRQRAFFNWSSGKDSALALYKAMESGRFDVAALFTTVDGAHNAVSMHGVSAGLLRKQAESMGLPLTVFSWDVRMSPAQYGAAMREAMERMKQQGIDTAIYGDIFLQEVRSRREEKLRGSGLRAAFPLWGMPPEQVMREVIDLGFRAVVTAVDGSVLDGSFVGRILDDEFLRALPPQADVCGENGEYHTFVFDGPMFRTPVAFQTEGVECREYAPDSAGKGARSYQLRIR